MSGLQIFMFFGALPASLIAMWMTARIVRQLIAEMRDVTTEAWADPNPLVDVHDRHGMRVVVRADQAWRWQ